MALELLCVAGTDGYFKEVNPAFTRVLGYSADELLARPFVDFVHPDDLEQTIAETAQVGAGRAVVDFENRYQHKDGHYVILSWKAAAATEDGLIYAVARDVTAERAANSELCQIKHALDQKSIVATTDIGGDIIEVNDRFCEISGYTREELIGQNHRILKSGAHPPGFYEGLWRTIASGQVWSGLIENRRKDGSHYFVYSVNTPIFDAAGKICKYLSIRFDTTQHVMLQHELRRTLGILNETSSIAKVGGWEMDVATGELTWTDETFNILEVEKQADRKPVLPEGLSLFTERHKPVIERAVSRAVEHGEPYALELEAKTAKGNVRWVYTNGKANYKDGKIVSLSGTIQDIHQRKIAEDRYAAERQKSLHQSKLASLGELAAGVAHEINNPLAVIYASIQLLPNFKDDFTRVDELYGRIEKACTRIERIVGSLQKFARSSEVPTYHRHDLAKVAGEALFLAQTRARRQDVEVTLECGAEVMINCDEVEIEQVVVNLINNAIDAVKDLDERWVRVVVGSEDGRPTLRVMDAGTGMPVEIQERLFDPFFSTKPVGEGTGLGLSITRGILEEHGAEIGIDAACERTCFVIRFRQASDPT